LVSHPGWVQRGEPMKNIEAKSDIALPNRPKLTRARFIECALY
jgi:hypothetical protein